VSGNSDNPMKNDGSTELSLLAFMIGK
jgi:hypothetical protein